MRPAAGQDTQRGLVVETRPIRDIDGLRQPVKGRDIELSQIEAGPLSGSLTYGLLGSFALSLGHFSRAVRARGIMSEDKQVIGMLLGRGGPVSLWSYDVEPGDILFDHLGGDHEAIYKSSASFATIALAPQHFADFMTGESEISDFDFWQRRCQLRSNGAVRQGIAHRLTAIISNLEQHAAILSPESSDFWMRAVVEAFVCAATGGVPQDANNAPVRAAFIIRRVDDLLKEEGPRPLHISEICQALGISRRTLHRAFDEVVGIGPVTYLRRQRLNGARTALQSEAHRATITQVAMRFGFDDVARFAGYYRQLFGERPSDTIRRTTGRMARL